MSYKNHFRLIVAATLALCLVPAIAVDLAHEHEAHGAATPTLNNGQKWSTDASLRKGMASIRDALLPQLSAVRANKLKASQYQALARQTHTQIGFIVANCKLAPQADAQLHLIIAELETAAEAMAGNSKQLSRPEGAMKLRHALETYGELFDHPGWRVPN